jgi:S1-C subfamily serine protease
VDLLDLAIVALAIAAAVGGFRLGFFARVVSWIGLALGLLIGARLLPTVIDAVRDADPTAKLLVAALVLLGGAFLGQGIGLLVGTHVGRVIPPGPLRGIDDAVGAAIGIVGVLVVVWLLLPTLGNVSGWPAIQARNSSIARVISRDFPSPPNTLEALRRLVGNNTFPQVFSDLEPSQNTGPPPADSGIPAALQARVIRSTVKVEGDACHRLQEGSGWTVSPGYVVTNAHVVAGEKSTLVRLNDATGTTLSARVVRFDADRDLALLAVPGLAEPALPVETSPGTSAGQQALVGTRGAVFGHPGGQNQIAVTPYLVSQYIEASGQDLYDSHSTLRAVFIMASDLMPGDSGGPLVNQAGAVIGVAFAIAPDRTGTSYALSYTEVRSFLASGSTTLVSTGPCLSD